MELKEISQNCYNYKLNLIHRRLYNGLEMDDLNFLDIDVDKIIEFIETNYKTNASRLSFYISLSSVCRSKNIKTYKIYYDKMMKESDELKKYRGKNTMSEQEKKNYLNFNDLIDASTDNLFEEAVKSLILHLPPRRNNDYILMKVIYGKKECDDDNYNYYYPDMNLLVYNTYKTVKYYGQCKIDLNSKDIDIIKYSKIKKILKKYVNQYLIKDGEFLLRRKYKNITPLIKKIFTYKDKSPSINLIRHAYATCILGKNYNYNLLKLIASYMGHSVEQQNFYKKIDHDYFVVDMN